MTTKLRFTLLLGLLMGGFLVAWLGLQYLAESDRNNLLANDRLARGQFLNHWLDVATRELPQFTAEVAQSEEFATLLREIEGPTARRKISSALARAGAAAMWVARPDGSIVQNASVIPDSEAPPLPLSSGELVTLLTETPSPRFFAEIGSELFEICVRRLQTGSSREWVLIARRWDNAHLRTLSALTESAVSLQPERAIAGPAPRHPNLVLLRPLNDWRGRAAKVLRLDYDLPEVEQEFRSDRRQVQMFFAFGLLVLAAMALALHSWVLRPLRRIRDCLAANDGTTVMELSKEKNEFGDVARLLLSSLAQRETLRLEIAERKRIQDALTQSESDLRRNIEERARLGRDLHDGVIQSLYAAGMGLSGIRIQLTPEQNDAAARLDQTRMVLNETIQDVRNFIVGLEPEALKVRSFSQTVSTLLDFMRTIRAFRSVVKIDDDLAARLTLAQRAHALQIAREAVSNALRHGEADQIEIALQQREGLVEFDVLDNGRGFDATLPEAHGNGLDHFVQRARELGAELIVQSQRGRGTRVQLSFSLS